MLLVLVSMSSIFKFVLLFWVGTCRSPTHTLKSLCVVCSVYSGHQSILIPPVELESNPALWLLAVSQLRVRDTFCSYSVMELCTKGLGLQTEALKVSTTVRRATCRFQVLSVYIFKSIFKHGRFCRRLQMQKSGLQCFSSSRCDIFNVFITLCAKEKLCHALVFVLLD